MTARPLLFSAQYTPTPTTGLGRPAVCVCGQAWHCGGRR